MRQHDAPPHPAATRRGISCAALLALCLLTACRQADGPVPVADEENVDRIGEMARGLEQIAPSDEQATRDLTGDLVLWADGRPEREALARELARRVVAAVRGRTISSEHAARLAHNLWMTMAARELGNGQVQALREELSASLTAIGAPDDRVQAVAEQADEVQRLVRTNPGRWYELY